MRKWAVVLSLLVCGEAAAQSTVWQWRAATVCGSTVDLPGPLRDSPAEAYADGVQYANSHKDSTCKIACGDGEFATSFEANGTPTFSTFPGISAITIKRLCASNGAVGTTGFTMSGASKAGPTCPAGEEEYMGGPGSYLSAPVKACMGGCEFTKWKGCVSTGGSYACGYKSTGAACQTSAATTGHPQQDGGDCVAGGDTVGCGSRENKNCGEFNGDRVCVGAIPPGTCVSFESGGVACVQQGDGSPPASPPAPNNGTTGTPAEPDGVVEAPTATGGVLVGHYYGPGTVAGSGSAPTVGAPGGIPIGTPGTGGGSGGEGGGEGEPCLGAACNAGVPDLDDIGTVSDAMGAFWGSLQAVPIVEAAAGLGATLGSGACPDWSTSVTVFGEAWEVDFSGICATWADVAGVLSVVMLVFWGFLAFRVLFSA